MFVSVRYLGLAVLVLVVMVFVSTFAAPENMDSHNLMEGASFSSTNEFSRQNTNMTCVKPGGVCKDRCDCCQHGIDSYDCKPSSSGSGSSSKKMVCTSTQPPPYRCAYTGRPPTKPCRPFDAVCVENCDCCQYDPERKKTRRVECERDWSTPVLRKKCTPAPFAYVDCFFIPTPPPSTTTTTRAPQG